MGDLKRAKFLFCDFMEDLMLERFDKDVKEKLVEWAANILSNNDCCYFEFWGEEKEFFELEEADE